MRQYLREYSREKDAGLMFPSLITRLCTRAEVAICPTDRWLPADKPFHPLRVTGEGTVVKSKKRKVTSTATGSESAPQGPFGILNSELQSIKELVSQLPSVPSSSQPGPSYFSREDMQGYLDAKKRQEENMKKMTASVTKLEGAYATLAKAHADLQANFQKEKKKNKKKNKFMVKMWRGIKAIFKWGQPDAKIPVAAEDDSAEYSFLSQSASDGGDDDDDDDEETDDDGATSAAQH
ncbi:uncharacterized protein LOC107761975 [Nicotiana tabacum]|uniref:Uncharacterized protein n=2 Tax=Nicotiana TaxID=4085 RepID=A0A1S3X7N3_TOBAC|nr:PREDICTED: uncharacterized protein LOC104231117 [Nicotiana sylvestris]XP_009782361.1 PREDICTED: uncharacterized protein LOC104231117 [Nicotiana sylvestris]XP_009782362.1 PREDICTED: uncharacterized protein LOC104231117 [Nicotiana sylvestris]XP_016435758.1 PREDICTED: uncharacterized protein LOC107761975 [Nicotiana tabacum]XP_016435759.1 PREDICTED: uncharacterized protein LOC107761975 [Nicotiana tabacum]